MWTNKKTHLQQDWECCKKYDGLWLKKKTCKKIGCVSSCLQTFLISLQIFEFQITLIH